MGPSKRGRKSSKEVMENLFDGYYTGIPLQVRVLISGWERDCNTKEEGEIQEEIMEFLKNPGNMRSILSLF